MNWEAVARALKRMADEPAQHVRDAVVERDLDFVTKNALVRRVIIDLLRDKYVGVSPYDINNGLCEDFQQDVLRKLEYLGVRADEGRTDGLSEYDLGAPGHCWIELGGICYDAESPAGVPSWRHLNIFKNWFADRDSSR